MRSSIIISCFSEHVEYGVFVGVECMDYLVNRFFVLCYSKTFDVLVCTRGNFVVGTM